jgi:hypothetical protein
MAEYIPFITGEDAGKLAARMYPESEVFRVPLSRARKIVGALGASSKIWLDPGLDGMHVLEARAKRATERKSDWFDLISSCEHFEKIGTPPFKASSAQVYTFAKAILDKCNLYNPAWLTVPQIPFKNSDRNRINRELAAASGRWKSTSGYTGKLILPLVFTNQDQINGKTARNPRVQQSVRCFREAGADGFWVVDSSLEDDSGSSTLGKRFRAVVDLHRELNECISSNLRIAGPYWGLNLILWAKGVVDHPAIGVGSGYQFLLSGGPTSTPSAKVALPSLRRRVGVGPQLTEWMDEVNTNLAPSNPFRIELTQIAGRLVALREYNRSREQVAGFYKEWVDTIARAPKAGRSMALFQDLAAAYALGKSLMPFRDEGTARQPESVAEPLMMICL